MCTHAHSAHASTHTDTHTQNKGEVQNMFNYFRLLSHFLIEYVSELKGNLKFI